MSVEVTGGGLDFEATIDGSKFEAEVAKLNKNIDQLTTRTKLYEAVVRKSFDPSVIVETNRKLEATQAEIQHLKNAGKTGFDELGNAVAKSTNYFKLAWSGIRQIAYILPGVGIAGILAFATGPILEYVAALIKGKDALNQSLQNLKALNEVQKEADKDAGKQIGNLKILYETATDVKNSMQDRILAAQELKKEFPDEFANAKALAIVNGDLKKSYDDLSTSILEVARAQSVITKIQKIEQQRADIAFQIAKNNTAKAAQLQRLANGDVNILGEKMSLASSVLASQGIAQTPQQTAAAVKAKIKSDTDIANADQLAKDKLLSNQETFLINYAGGNAKLAKILEGGGKIITNVLAKYDSILKADPTLADLQNLQASLQDVFNHLVVGKDDKEIADVQGKLDKVQSLINNYSPKIVADQLKHQQNIANQLLAAQTSVQQKIDAVKDRYASKQKTRDDQEIDAIKANFKVANDAIDAQNKKLQDALKTKKITPAQASIYGLQPIANLSDTDQNNAIEALLGRRDFETEKLTIEKQKAIYQQYEDFKLKAGTQAADKLYETQIGSFKSYVEYLKSLEPTIAELNSPDAKIKAKASATQDFLNKEEARATTQELVQHQKHLQALLLQHQDYEQKRQTLISNANDDIADLIKAGDNQGAEQAKKDLENQLTSLDEAQVKKLDSYKELFSGIYDLTAAQSKKDIQSIKNYIDNLKNAGKITKEAYDSISKLLGNKSLDIDNKLPDELKEIGGLFQNIGSEVSGIDEGLSKALQTAGSLVSAFGSMKANFNTLNSSTASSTEKLTSGLGLIGTAIGVVTTVISLFDHSKEAAEQLQYESELQLKAIEAVNSSLERQLELTKEIQGPERLTAYKKDQADIAADIIKTQDEINSRFSLTGNKLIDADIAKRNNGKRGNPFLDSTIKQFQQLGVSASLAGKPIEYLQQLLESNKLDENTAALVQSLVDLKQKAKETQNALNEDITGINFDDLKNSIKEVFESGKTDAQSFADAIEKSIRGAFANAFERNEIDKALQPFYNELAKDGADGTFTPEEISKLRDMKSSISDALSAKAKVYQDIIGPDSTSTASTSISGQIQKSITEDTGTKLVGISEGIQLSNVQIRDATLQLRDLNARILANGVAAIQLLTGIRDNTNVLPETLPDMNKTLKNIDKNTGAAGSGADLNRALRAAGIIK